MVDYTPPSEGEANWDVTLNAALADIAAAVDTKGDATEAYVQSRAGTDLVTNGTGLLGDNTNFSQFTFDPSDRPIGGGGFRTNAGSNNLLTTDEIIPVDLSRRYLMRVQARQRSAGITGYVYIGLIPVDVAGMNIGSEHYMVRALDSETTLSADLDTGDTVIHLTDLSLWNTAAAAPHQRRVIFWDYTDPTGFTWDPLTYSRHVTPYAGIDVAGFNFEDNELTLLAPWAGAPVAAGTVVHQGSAGGSYMYVAAANGIPAETWTVFEGSCGGLHTNPLLSATAAFPPGTSFVRPLFIPNRDVAGAAVATSQHIFAAVSFSDATEALRYARVGATAPTTGVWKRGDIVWNVAPSAAGTVGWVCVTAGTPGTWKTFGTIAS